MNAVPVKLDGPKVQLFPGFAQSRAVSSPARLAQDDVAEHFLFDAGGAIQSIDLFAGFWREEAVDMDWLEDFLCDVQLQQTIEVLMAPPEEEEEVEEMYSRRDLTTLGSEVIDVS
jgi:hypothetical protein